MTKQVAPALPRLAIDFASVCRAIGISRRTAEILIEQKEFPRAFFIGGKRFYRPADIQAFIDGKAAEASGNQAA